MMGFKVGDHVTPKKDDPKLGEIHGTMLIVTSIIPEDNVICVQLENGKFVSGNREFGIIYGHRPERFFPSRFELITPAKPETIEDRIKKLYRKCKTTKHWG